MGLFDDFVKELVGVSGSETTEHPCQNCPSDCALAPSSCTVCKPYKEKLVDALYRVEHVDEIRAKYVVSGVGTVTSVKCPYCGATSSNPSVCEYCDSPLEGGTDKIMVASASDIPNPILEAQDIIFARYAAVKGGTTSTDTGFLSQVFSFLGSEDDESVLGAKMTETEIQEAASSYGVSIADYLEGLDNGRYLTLQGKKTASQAQSYTSTNEIPSSAHVPGLAGMAVGSLLGSMTGHASSAGSWSRDADPGNWSYRPAEPHGGHGGPGMGGPGGRGGMGGPGMGGPGGRGGMGGPGGGPGMGGHGGPGGPGGRGGMHPGR